MKPTNWKDVAEQVGILAIIISLVFIFQQLKQGEVVAVSELRAAFLANRIELNNAIMDHADVWVRGNAGEELNPDEAAIFHRQVMNMNDYFFQIVQYSRLMGLDWEDAELAEFGGYLHENLGARRVWMAREKKLQKYRAIVNPDDTFTTDWIIDVESKLAMFDQANDR